MAMATNSFETLESWADFSSIIMRRQHGVEIAKLQWRKLLKEHGHYRGRRLSGDSGPSNATKRSTSFESYDLMLMFKDESERPLSSKTLTSIMKAQSEVANLRQYKAQCLVHAPNTPHAGECVVASSPVNWVAAFVGSNFQGGQDVWQNKSLRIAQKAAQCFDIAIGQFVISLVCSSNYLTFHHHIPPFTDT